MWPPGQVHYSCWWYWKDSTTTAMGTTNVFLSACTLISFVLLSGLENTAAIPSFDPPQSYPAGLRRSADPISLETDETFDDLSDPWGLPSAPAPAFAPAPAPAPVPASMPALNPLLPLIKLKPGKMGPIIDPSLFIQMKADKLKNLFGPGGIGGMKSPMMARAVSSGASKWAAGKPAPGPSSSAPASKWMSAKSKIKESKATPAPGQASPWSWPSQPSAPAKSAPAAPSQYYPAPPAPVQSYPSSALYPLPAPGYPAPSYPAPGYPAPGYPAPGYPAPGYPAPGYPAPSYPAPGYPAPGYPAPSPPSAPGVWIPTNPLPADFIDQKTALVDAFLEQYLTPQALLPASRPARLVDSASPAPSPYLTNLLDSLNLTLPAMPPTLKPTVEPPGFWFPSVVAAPPGSLYPFVVDPTAMVAKKGKFLSDLFASKAAANAAIAAAAASPASSLIARDVDNSASEPSPSPAHAPAARDVNASEYAAKVATYLNNILDPTSAAKRAAAPAPKKSMKTSKSSKPSKTAKPAIPAPVVEEEEQTPEDEMALEQYLGLRKKREIGDETDATLGADASPETDATTVAAKSAALLSDMAIVKQNILAQLDAMSKAESAASKATKLAAKAAKKASTLATLLNLPAPAAPAMPSASLADYQQKIATLTNLYSTLSDTQKNITGAPDANDPFNTDKLFIAAVNIKMTKTMMKNALLPTLAGVPAPAPAPKVTRSNHWQNWRAQDAGTPSQYDSGSDSETETESEPSPGPGSDANRGSNANRRGDSPRREKNAAPLVAAVFAPQNYHFSREPNSWN